MKAALLISTGIIALSIHLPPAIAQDNVTQEQRLPRAGQAPSGQPGGANTAKPANGQGEATPQQETQSSESRTKPVAGEADGQDETQLKREKPQAATGAGTGAGQAENGESSQRKPAAENSKAAPNSSTRVEEQNRANETKRNATSSKANASEDPDSSQKAARKPGTREDQQATPNETKGGPESAKTDQQTGTHNRTNGAADTNSRTGNAANTAGTDETKKGSVQAQGRIKLDQAQASTFRDRLVSRYERDATNVNFSVSIGVAVPTSVRVRELPPEIVSEYPEFRGYDFVIVRDQVVIVQPETREVVEVIGGGSGEFPGNAGRRSRQRFGHDEDALIRRHILADRTVIAEGGERPVLRAPSSAQIRPLPDTIASDMPDARDYGYFVDRENRVVVVDSSTREVVDIIE